MVDISRAIESQTPKKSSTSFWKTTSTPSPSRGQFTMAMKIFVPWWKRKPFWMLMGLVLFLLGVQIEVDSGGWISGIISKAFVWVRTQPWITAMIAGGFGYFIRDRAIALIPRHEIPPEGKK